MCVYLHGKFEVSSIIPTSFRQGVNLPPPPPQNKPLKSLPRLGLTKSIETIKLYNRSFCRYYSLCFYISLMEQTINFVIHKFLIDAVPFYCSRLVLFVEVIISIKKRSAFIFLVINDEILSGIILTRKSGDYF